jgi:hypothetical protein
MASNGSFQSPLNSSPVVASQRSNDNSKYETNGSGTCRSGHEGDDNNVKMVTNSNDNDHQGLWFNGS